MQVKDLIELLQMENPDAEVHFQYNYGDHWRTQVAPSVRSVYEGYVKFSAYHNMDKVVDMDDYEDEDELATNSTPVVLIG